MAWTAPRTWVDTELVTASMMNTHVRDNENHLHDVFSGAQDLGANWVAAGSRALILGTGTPGAYGFLRIKSTLNSYSVWIEAPASADALAIIAGNPHKILMDADVGGVVRDLAVWGAGVELWRWSTTGVVYMRNSSLVAHGMTGQVPTDVYAEIRNLQGTHGGLFIAGYTDNDAVGLYMRGIIGTASPSTTTPAIFIEGYKKNGTGIQALAATDMLLQFKNGNTPAITFLGNGFVGFGAAGAGSAGGGVGGGTAPAAELHIATGSATAYVERNSADAVGPVLTLRKSRGTPGAAANAASADSLGILSWTGFYGNLLYGESARIQAKATEAFSGASNQGASLSIQTCPTGSGTLAARIFIPGEGNVLLGNVAQLAEMATSAITSLPYMPTMNGAPSGTPTAYTGGVAFVYDRANNKLYVYNGAWKGVVLA